MGNSGTRNSPDPRVYFAADLPKFVVQTKVGNAGLIGDGKCMKTYFMRAEGVPVVVKVYMRLPDEDLSYIVTKLNAIWMTLNPAKFPQILPYQMWIRSNSKKAGPAPVYLVRQYLANNLHDRVLTRCFLNETEKLWVIFQLCKALEICHTNGVVHGDLKPENVLCTSSNFVILADFAFYKPTSIPDDDTDDFQYYFDSMGRRSCYVAPERFVRKEHHVQQQQQQTGHDDAQLDADEKRRLYTLTTTPQMDIFSLGCTIAEIYLDCKMPLLDLPAMHAYLRGGSKSGGEKYGSTKTEKTASRKGSLDGSSGTGSGASKIPPPPLDRLDRDDSPARAVLARIENPVLRDVVVHMTQKDPEARLSATQYLHLLQGGRDEWGVFAASSSSFPSSAFQPQQDKGRVLFPPCFSQTLLPFFVDSLHFQGCTPDDRIQLICDNYTSLFLSITGKEDRDGQQFFSQAMGQLQSASSSSSSSPSNGAETDTQSDATAVRTARREDFLQAACVRTCPHTGRVYTRELYGGVKSEHPPGARVLQKKGGNGLKDSSAGANNVAKDTDTLLARCLEFIEAVERPPIAPPASPSFDDSAASSSSRSPRLNQQYTPSTPSLGFLEPELGHLESQEGLPSGQPRILYDGLVLLVQVVSSCFRHVKLPQTKVICVMLLTRLGAHCDDEIILQRILPLLVTAMEDQLNATVRAMAVRSLRVLLSLVRTFSSSESEIFKLYIFPVLNKIVRDPDIIVRVAFAESIGHIVEASKRFLDTALLMAQMRETSASKSGKEAAMQPHANSPLPPTAPVSSSSTRSVGTVSVTQRRGSAFSDDSNASLPALPPLSDIDPGTAAHVSYAAKLGELHSTVYNWVKILTNEGGPGDAKSLQAQAAAVALSHGSLIKRMMLATIYKLCIFFGPEKTVNLLLPHLLTFFNDWDWELRHAFWSVIGSVCTFLGATLTENYILPLVENGLVDVEEKVVVMTLSFLQMLCELSLLSRRVVVSYLRSTVPLLLHPSLPIRSGALSLSLANIKLFGSVDAMVHFLPILAPVLKYDCSGVELTEEAISLALMSPLSRRAYRRALLDRQGRNRSATQSSRSLDEPLLRALSEPGDVPANTKSGKPPRKEARKSFAEGIAQSSSSSSSPSSSSSSYMSPAQQEQDLAEDESEKISFMSSYLDQAAREMSAKASQWRNGLASGQPTSTIGASLRRSLSLRDQGSASTLDTLLDITAHALPEQHLQVASIPHQKSDYVAYHSLIIPDGLRHVHESGQFDLLRDPKHFQQLFALTFQTAEVGRSSASPDAGAAGAGAGAGAGGGMAPRGSVLPTDDMRLPDRDAASRPVQARVAVPSVKYLGRLVKALGIPPLPPDIGSLMQPTPTESAKPEYRYYNQYTEPLDTTSSPDHASSPQGRPQWRPKENVLICSLGEHTRSVNRLAVCPDNSFFCSASSDCTVKIWQLKGIDKQALPRSKFTYRHSSPVLDICAIENSHSMASAAQDGTIHVWRVDAEELGKARRGGSGGDDIGLSVDGAHSSGVSIEAGATSIKTLDAMEGPIVSLQHFNGDVCSVLTYLTQKGGLHGWDLRASRESFQFPIRPELGYPTSMTLSPDRSWVCIGTSHGYISLWDLRYNIMCKLWQHSSAGPVHRLACCKSYGGAGPGLGGSSTTMSATEGAYLFVAAGKSETAVWGLPEAGECVKCFRSLPLSSSREPLAPLPVLADIALPRHPHAPVWAAYARPRDTPDDLEPSVRAIIGRTPLHLVTAGTDRQIRFWDFSSPSKCFTVAGLEPGQPKSTFEQPLVNGASGQLFVCYDAALPSPEMALETHLPVREYRGPVQPSNAFRDAITDLKSVEMPIRMLLSSSRDGKIKIWR